MNADDLLAEAVAVLSSPDLSDLFSPNALSEVAITATLQGQRIAGTIDRLVILTDRVIAVDFKSNKIVPRTVAEVPDGILRQMGAYAHALAQIYPDRRIETAIVWTSVPKLMHLDPETVRAALARASLA